MNSEQFYRLVGSLIRKRRKELKWTQERLASRLGISRASLANMEIGRQGILLHHFFQVADALQVDVTALLPAPTELHLKVDTTHLQLPANLNPEQKAQIARMLKGSSAETAPTKEAKYARSPKARS